jgi:phosphotransferase system enzyme I (PtsI)
MNKLLKGVGASAGVAIAKLYLLCEPEFTIDDSSVDNINTEIKSYQSAIDVTVKQLEKIKAIANQKMGTEKAEIFEAHIQIANDPQIKQEVESTISNTKVNAAFAIDYVFNKYHEIFKNMTDAYFKDRATDVLDVRKRILSNVLKTPLPDISDINEKVVLVAHDLTPSETALLDKNYVQGFVTEIGGRTSHAAIMARTMEIPAVLGVNDILKNVHVGDMIGLNGTTGEIEINPTNADD